MYEFIVNGVPLRDPRRRWFIDYTKTQNLSVAARSLTGAVTGFGYHGAMAAPAPSFFGTTQYSIVINIDGSNKAEHDSILASFHGLFQSEVLDLQLAPQGSPMASPTSTATINRTFNSAVNPRSAKARTVGSLAVEKVGSSASRVTVVLELLGLLLGATAGQTAIVPTTTPTVYDISTEAGDSTGPVMVSRAAASGTFPVGSSMTFADPSRPERSIQFICRSAHTGAVNFYMGDSTYSSSSRFYYLMGSTGRFYIEPDGILEFPGRKRHRIRMSHSGVTNPSIALTIQRTYLP